MQGITGRRPHRDPRVPLAGFESDHESGSTQLGDGYPSEHILVLEAIRKAVVRQVAGWIALVHRQELEAGA
jgi:hypothetical protein